MIALLIQREMTHGDRSTNAITPEVMTGLDCTKVLVDTIVLLCRISERCKNGGEPSIQETSSRVATRIP